MTTLVDKPKNLLNVDFKRISRDMFMFSVWFGNIFINPKDIIPKEESRR